MISIVILGAGNVATHLFSAFRKSKNIQVKQVYNRSEKGLLPFQKFTKTTTNLKKLAPADVYLIAVKDDTIKALVKKIPSTAALIAHTSGSMPLLNGEKSGVFYPLQTFSKDKAVDFKEVPFCLEASEQNSYRILEQMAQQISHKVFSIDSKQRKALHVAAVFVSNFTNYMYTLGEKICQENQVPFETLHALMTETTQKAIQASPEKGQTGPAIRDDQQTIAAHLEKLSAPEFKEIYTLLTQKIQVHYGKKL